MADKREFKITCIIVIISVPAFLRKRPVKIPLESSVNNVRGKWITFQGVRKLSLGNCRESRVESNMSRVETDMSRVEKSSI